MKKQFLRADEGMVYTNGTMAAPCVFLASGEDESLWRQVPEQEAALLQEAEAVDYCEALERFGVMV